METLGERITAAEAKDLASQLPREIGYFLFRGAMGFSGERFGYREFIERVACRECVKPGLAAYHSRVVMEVVSEAVSLGEMEHIVEQLPLEYEPLFGGSSGGASPRQNRRTGAEADQQISAPKAKSGLRSTSMSKAANRRAQPRSKRQRAEK